MPLRRRLLNAARRLVGSTPAAPPRAPAPDWVREAGPPQSPLPEPPRVEVDATEAWRRVREEGAVIIDVREPHELLMGLPTGAWTLPLGRLGQHLDWLPRDRPLIAVCAAGARSLDAALLLRDRGFEDAWSLEGGLPAWIDAGAPWRQPRMDSRAELTRRVQHDGQEAVVCFVGEDGGRLLLVRGPGGPARAVSA